MKFIPNHRAGSTPKAGNDFRTVRGVRESEESLQWGSFLRFSNLFTWNYHRPSDREWTRLLWTMGIYYYCRPPYHQPGPHFVGQYFSPEERGVKITASFSPTSRELRERERDSEHFHLSNLHECLPSSLRLQVHGPSRSLPWWRPSQLHAQADALNTRL